jgi:hypothetical protein
MKFVILILGFTSISGLIQTHYKRLHLDDTEWPGYISKTVPFKGHLNFALPISKIHTKKNLGAVTQNLTWLKMKI